MSDATNLPNLIKYGLLQTTEVPSLICDVFVYIHFIRHWRKEIIDSPHNHAILCLLTLSFLEKITDVPFVLHLLRWNVVIQQTYSFCVFWSWSAYSLVSVMLLVLAWCCIERHLFVFHTQMMKKKSCLILFHYIPLIICLFYVPILYIRYIYFPPTCENIWDYSLIWCGGACYSYYDRIVGTTDWLINYAAPTLIIFLSNVSLFCRFIWQKMKHQQAIRWSRQKRMIIQLLFLSSLVLILTIPTVTVGVIQVLWLPTFFSDIQINYFFYCVYFINQFLPFVIVSSLPEMRKDLRRWIEYVKRYFGRQMRINPNLAVTATNGNHPTI